MCYLSIAGVGARCIVVSAGFCSLLSSRGVLLWYLQPWQVFHTFLLLLSTSRGFKVGVGQASVTTEYEWILLSSQSHLLRSPQALNGRPFLRFCSLFFFKFLGLRDYPVAKTHLVWWLSKVHFSSIQLGFVSVLSFFIVSASDAEQEHWSGMAHLSP